MAAAFLDFMSFLESSGFFDVLLPFLLVFTLVFAMLQKIGVLGADKKIDLIVSLVLAFLAIRSVYFIGLLQRFIPNIAMFIVIIFYKCICSELPKTSELCQ